MKYHAIVLFACAFSILGPAMAKAETFDCEIKPSGKDNFSKAAFRLWLDDAKKPARAILLLAPGWNGDGRGLAGDNGWQDFAREHQLAIVAIQFQSSEKTTPYHVVEAGSGQALLKAINTLASDSKHPELANAPLLMWGHSAGGQFNYGFACFRPGRVIAFAAIKGGYYESKFNPLVRQVPAVFIIGEKDERYRIDNITKLFTENRRAGALWCVATEPGHGHDVGKSNDLIRPFLAGVLAKRLAGSTLSAAPAETGWFGDLGTKTVKPAAGSPRERSAWLPDETSAQAWKSFVTS